MVIQMPKPQKNRKAKQKKTPTVPTFPTTSPMNNTANHIDERGHGRSQRQSIPDVDEYKPRDSREVRNAPLQRRTIRRPSTLSLKRPFGGSRPSGSPFPPKSARPKKLPNRKTTKEERHSRHRVPSRVRLHRVGGARELGVRCDRKRRSATKHSLPHTRANAVGLSKGVGPEHEWKDAKTNFCQI